MNRRRVLFAGALLGASLTAHRAFAANAAESFIADNIHLGFDILNNKELSDAQRREKFAAFLLDLTDMKRVALFMLGSRTTAPADQDAFVAAFQDYTLAVYQSYFAQYAGQSLRVTGSRMRAPDDFIVHTETVDSSNAKLEIDFRVRTDAAKPALVDFSVAGVWLGVAERDEFASVLARNNGDINALIAHLRDAEKLYR